jgi:hypothetical protein
MDDANSNLILIAFLASLADAGMTLLSGLVGSSEFHALFGVSRDNLYGHVSRLLSPQRPLLPHCRRTLVGGVISEDRQHGTSALYFLKPDFPI